MPDIDIEVASTDSHGQLRIAVIAPPWFEVPPADYGGIEGIVASLVDGLVDRGHDVTLIASGDNHTKANTFLSVYASPPSQRLGEPGPELVAAAAADLALRNIEVDVIHDHSLAGPLGAAGRAAPTVATMHGPVQGELGAYWELLERNVHLVAISRAQREIRPQLNWIDVVHNAIDVESFPYREDKEDFLLWLGRFSPDKGAHLALDAAEAAGRRLVLAGKKSEPAEQEYFAAEVEPRLGDNATYVGMANGTQKRELLSAASALLFPIQWEEPFGLVMIEAMACGTPVVALARGSVPEVVENGTSGIVVNSPDELPAALEEATRIDPAKCRERALTHFDLPTMVDRYINVFRQVAAQTDLVSIPQSGREAS